MIQDELPGGNKGAGPESGIPILMPKMNQIERFWSKVDKTSSPFGCWLWTAGLFGASGYAAFHLNHKITMRAHRLSYFLTYGGFDWSLEVQHQCEDKYSPGDITCRRCVNPSHLKLGRPRQNSETMGKAGRGVRQDKENNPMAKLTEVIVGRIRASSEPAKTLSARYGVSPSLINMIQLNKIWYDPSYTPRGRRRSRKIEPKEARAIFLTEGLTQSKVARRFGVSSGLVGMIKRREIWCDVTEGLVVTPSTKRRANSNVTEEVAIQIYLTEGVPQLELGNRFGVSQMTVSLIKRGKIWKDVTSAFAPTDTPSTAGAEQEAARRRLLSPRR